MAEPSLPVREGYVSVTGGRVWYRQVGEGGGIPLLALHGGPGSTHHPLEPLEALAGERPVIVYDQLGSGRSERPGDRSLWRIERFVEEVGQVRAALGLERVHLLGHSWGTILALEYALTRPAGLVSMVYEGPCFSIPRFSADAMRLRAQLPPAVLETLQRHEAAGTLDSDEYKRAEWEFYKRFVYGMETPTESIVRSRAEFGRDVYETMWGPNEMLATGSLKDYDRTGRLVEIGLPTLFLCGRYDECTPEATAWYRGFVPGSRLAVFEHSAHMPHLTDRDEFLRVLRAFLHEVEQEMK